MTTAALPPIQPTTPESSPEQILPQPLPSDHQTLDELDRSLDMKGTALDLDRGRMVVIQSEGVLVIDKAGERLYPRDGDLTAAYIEGRVSNVTIRGRHKNIIWSSGESAVRESVNFAAVHMADRGTRKGDDPIIAHSRSLYSQSGVYFGNEKKKGVDVIDFDSGNEEEVAEVVERGADVIFAETVANTPDMPVLNIHRLLQQVRELDPDDRPILVIDDTTTLRTGLQFAGLVEPSDRVILVQSGTKNLMNNSELLGITYSPNLELIQGLRKYKAHSGAVNSIGALASIAAKLRLTLPGFHDRNRAVFNSTGKIARALEEAEAELGPDTDFTTVFPTSPKHGNYDYARKITPADVDCISPVVFITPWELSQEGTHDLIRRLSEHPAMREQIEEGQIHLGQSFGTPRARILYDRKAPNVRFAGGFDIADDDSLAAAIKEAAADK